MASSTKFSSHRWHKSRQDTLLYRVLVTMGLLLLMTLTSSAGTTPVAQPSALDDLRQISTIRVGTEYPKGFCDRSNNPDSSVIRRPPFLAVLIPGVVFTFEGLAVVTDDYFVPSLERICERLHLSEDVAGATFMAAGSSAPELFTSILAVFVTQDDVGIGTIVGSAVFNILVIIGLSAALAGGELKLDFRPLLRDSIFYVLSIALLMLFVLLFGNTSDGAGTGKWYEGLILMAVYGVYILFMKFLNKPYMAFMGKRFLSSGDIEENGEVDLEVGSARPAATSSDVTSVEHDPTVNQVRRLVRSSRSSEKVNYAELSPRAKFRVLQLAVIATNGFASSISAEDDGGDTLIDSVRVEEEGAATSRLLGFDRPKSTLGWIQFWSSLPWLFAFKFTIMDCSKDKNAKWWWLTFTTSILWIMGISYVMVEAARLAGCLIGIPASVMGLTVLAAGTSVPDALASVAVARNGQGDMAVSNAIGSNVFDILLGLGLPWFLGDISGRTAHITISPITVVVVPVAILFCIIVALLVLLILFKWKLSRIVGYLLFLLYAVFVTYQLVDTFVISKNQD